MPEPTILSTLEMRHPTTGDVITVDIPTIEAGSTFRFPATLITAETTHTELITNTLAENTPPTLENLAIQIIRTFQDFHRFRSLPTSGWEGTITTGTNQPLTLTIGGIEPPRNTAHTALEAPPNITSSMASLALSVVSGAIAGSLYGHINSAEASTQRMSLAITGAALMTFAPQLLRVCGLPVTRQQERNCEAFAMGCITFGKFANFVSDTQGEARGR